MSYRIRLSCTLLVLAAASAFAQADKKVALGKSDKERLIASLADVLRANYVDEKIGSDAAHELAAALERGEFERLSEPKEFAKAVTEKLQAMTHDQHLSLNYSAKPMAVPSGGPKQRTPEEAEGMRNYGEAINYGFSRAERLPGNIAYLKIDLFFPAEFGGEAAVAAMNWVAPSEALIIDLRANDGGSPEMMTLVTSYLFGPQPVWYGGAYERAGNVTRQYWTMPYVPGRRFADKDVFILTSKRTFSAAEGFAYNLQALKRAVIVGEVTGGGAHPRDVYPIAEHFWAGIPVARGVNPITGTDWEGKGVQPDVNCAAGEAVRTAVLAELDKRLEKTTDGDDRKRIEELRKKVQDGQVALPQ